MNTTRLMMLALIPVVVVMVTAWCASTLGASDCRDEVRHSHKWSGSWHDHGYDQCYWAYNDGVDEHYHYVRLPEPVIEEDPTWTPQPTTTPTSVPTASPVPTATTAPVPTPTATPTPGVVATTTPTTIATATPTPQPSPAPTTTAGTTPVTSSEPRGYSYICKHYGDERYCWQSYVPTATPTQVVIVDDVNDEPNNTPVWYLGAGDPSDEWVEAHKGTTCPHCYLHSSVDAVADSRSHDRVR